MMQEISFHAMADLIKEFAEMRGETYVPANFFEMPRGYGRISMTASVSDPSGNKIGQINYSGVRYSGASLQQRLYFNLDHRLSQRAGSGNVLQYLMENALTEIGSARAIETADPLESLAVHTGSRLFSAFATIEEARERLELVYDAAQAVAAAINSPDFESGKSLINGSLTKALETYQ